jgi:hypothetical protein
METHMEKMIRAGEADLIAGTVIRNNMECWQVLIVASDTLVLVPKGPDNEHWDVLWDELNTNED